MNKIIITGHLTDDPKSGTTPNGIEYCNFTVAVSDFSKNTSFFKCVAWRNQAKACMTALHKGSKALVSGSITLKVYESGDRHGLSAEVTAQEVEFLSPKQNSGSYTPANDLGQLTKVDEELPF